MREGLLCAIARMREAAAIAYRAARQFWATKILFADPGTPPPIPPILQKST